MEKSQHSWYSCHEKRETDADRKILFRSRIRGAFHARKRDFRLEKWPRTGTLTFSDPQSEVTLGRDLDRSIKITCPRQGNRIINREADDQMEYNDCEENRDEIITQRGEMSLIQLCSSVLFLKFNTFVEQFCWFWEETRINGV